VVNLRYCEKCDKYFDDDCVYCSYCGGELEYRSEQKSIGTLEGIKIYHKHFINVFIWLCISMIPLLIRDFFNGKSFIEILAVLAGTFGLYNILAPCHTKDEAIFCSSFSNFCFVICIVLGVISR
jgi:hypothetical protein